MLIDEIFDPTFIQDKLGFADQVSFDYEKFVMCGHSFGGMTALEVARTEPRVKFLFTIDPWLWVKEEQINKKEFIIDCP